MKASAQERELGDADTMPGVLGEIAREVGLPVALKLAHALGGTVVMISSRLSDQSLLVRAVGRADAEKIVKLLGRGKIEIPLGPTSDSRRMRAKIAELIEAGAGTFEIARRLHVHARTVRLHRARLAAGRQADLFDR
jgi:DNA-binding NarL/FixJ family response regulator